MRLKNISLIMGLFLLFTATLNSPFASENEAQENKKAYTINPDGSADWFTYHGFIMYGVNCYTCHGPGAMGSTFAPNLTESIKTIDFQKFTDTVTNGRPGRMPSFGYHYGVICSLDHLYAYLKARGDNAVGAGELQRTQKPKIDKNERYRAYKVCLKSLKARVNLTD